MSHNVIKSSKPIKKIRFYDDFTVDELVIDPEEEERIRREEEDRRREEEFERRLKEGIEKAVAQAREQQKSEMTSKYEKEKEESYKTGFNDGKEVGLSEGKSMVKPSIEELHKVAKNLSEELDWVIHEAEKEIMELCYLIAKKVINHEIEKDDTIILNVLQESLDYVANETEITIKLSPNDYNFVKEYKKDITSSLTEIKNLKFESDDKISRGGCLIETNSGEVDARLETKLEELERVLLGGKKRGL